MTYIISKQSKKEGRDRRLYYVVQSYREQGKVKRKTIAQLGEAQTPLQALDHIREQRKEIGTEMEGYKEEITHPQVRFGTVASNRKVLQKYIAECQAQLLKLDDWENKLKELIETHKL